ncbi:MAG TPA: hypothetical protein VFJ14_17865 [Nocardioidaceae bacterium]|nr:hypothetical protein [Nocardioidaceae bacterium]
MEMTTTKEHTMTSYTIPEARSADAAYCDDIMRQARADAANGTEAEVTYWDATSDPANPGWVRRTYWSDGTSTDDIL